jgi:Tfp pilus assembly protein PilV
MKTPHAQRGFTILEGLIAMVLMVIGVLGLAGLQVVGVRANHFGKRMSEASALALDLEEQMGNWAYADSRFNTTVTASGPSDSNILGWDLGRAAATSYQPMFSDLPGDTNVASGYAGVLATNYQGIQSDVSSTGSPDYIRYWNVYSYNDGTSNGKLVQIFVRWKEPALGYRQITATAFKTNPAGFMGLL